MADDTGGYYKRKLEDSSLQAPRRATGFSSPGAGAPPPSDIELAKQKAQAIAAKLFSEATTEAKKPRFDVGDLGGAAEHTRSEQKPSVPSLSSLYPTSTYAYQPTSKKIEIPNGKVGVIIGKSGDTIKYLQLQSGAKIQVTRDMDADPNSLTRPVELMGTSEQISKAEQLINEVLAEADAGAQGGSAGRKYGAPQTSGEQFQMKVANNKVGLIIGKGGETIKTMQAKSGARIQIVPLHLPPGDTSTERTVYIDGTPEQIEAAKQLVNEVVNSENRARNPMSGGYPSQGYNPHPPTSWVPPGAPPVQQPNYGYVQQGAYPGAPPQYPPQSYGSYPPPAPGSYQTGWDQSTNQQGQQQPPASGYDYYNQQQPPQQQTSTGVSSAPSDSSGYNYGQPLASGTYVDSTYAQQTGWQQGYATDGYSSGYQTSSYGTAPNSQAGYSQPVSATQTGYGGAPGHQDGSASSYSAPGATSAVPLPQQAPPPGTGNQTGYAAPPPGTTASSYGAPGAASSAYSVQPAPPQGYSSQHQQAGYPQYTQTQAAYGHSQQSQTAYGYSAHPGYGQTQAYPGAPSAGNPSYGQQQSLGDSYGGGSYLQQPPAYSADGAGNAAKDNSAPALASAAPPAPATSGGPAEGSSK